MNRKTYVIVTNMEIEKVKKYVYSLNFYNQQRYHSLLSALSNNFYGSCKALTEEELAQFNLILNK